MQMTVSADKWISEQNAARRLRLSPTAFRAACFNGGITLPSRNVAGQIHYNGAATQALADSLSKTDQHGVGALTRHVLATERWFADGAFGPSRLTDEIVVDDTQQVLEAKQKKLVKQLRRHGPLRNSTALPALRLAHRLQSCKPEDRCCCGVCFHCHAAFRRCVVAEFERIAHDPSIEVAEELAALTIVPPESFDVGDLFPSALQGDFLKRMKDQASRALKEAGITVAFGGIDVSLNRHATGAFTQHFKPHLTTLVLRSQYEAGQRALRKLYPATPTESKPLWGPAFDGSSQWLRYCLKNDFGLRVTPAAKILPDGTIEPPQYRPPTRMPAVEKVELMLALSQFDLRSRLFLLGINLRRLPSGPAMMLRKPLPISSPSETHEPDLPRRRPAQKS